MIKYRELKRRYELDGPQTHHRAPLRGLAQKHLRAEDFSLRDLAEALVPDGHHWVRAHRPAARRRRGAAGGGRRRRCDRVSRTSPGR